MIDAQTLLGLACLIANQGRSAETAKIEKSLTSAEHAQVQAVIDSGTCLPGGIEALLRETRRKIDQGELENREGGSEPTADCAHGGHDD